MYLVGVPEAAVNLGFKQIPIRPDGIGHPGTVSPKQESLVAIQQDQITSKAERKDNAKNVFTESKLLNVARLQPCYLQHFQKTVVIPSLSRYSHRL